MRQAKFSYVGVCSAAIQVVRELHASRTTTTCLNSARSPIVLMEQITVDGVSTLKKHSAGLLTPTCSFWVYIQLTIDR
jgi:hypothetical protein